MKQGNTKKDGGGEKGKTEEKEEKRNLKTFIKHLKPILHQLNPKLTMSKILEDFGNPG